MMAGIYSQLINTSGITSSLYTGNPVRKSEYDFDISNLSYKDAVFKDEARCLIIPSLKTSDSGRIKNSIVSDENIRLALLMWDFFDLPQDSSIYLSLPFSEELISLGVARQSSTISQGNIGKAYPAIIAKLFKSYEALQPNIWSIFTDSENLKLMEPGSNNTGILKFTSCIPIPGSDVPFEEILHFKSRREAELLELRGYIEKIVKRIQEAGDGDMQLEGELNNFRKAAENHLRVSKESGLKFKLGDLSGSFNLIAPISGAIASYASGLPITSGLIAGTVAGFSFSPSIKVSYSRVGATPLRYISRAHTELPWGQ